MLVHRINNGQRLHAHTKPAHERAALLLAFFDDEAGAHKIRLCAFYKRD
jgi:hypothetical protein